MSHEYQYINGKISKTKRMIESLQEKLKMLRAQRDLAYTNYKEYQRNLKK